ncbi:MAG: ABC transporter ATP-binding protein [Candidatus Deferrimicrobiaceae bacterium]
MIEAFRVGAVSRGRTLWEGLDLAAGDGEIWVVTGPPACGKTLLMRILRGERRPDSGDVVAGGESLYRGSPGHNLRFRAFSGMVPEYLPVPPGRTVGDLFRLSALAAGGVVAAERTRRMEELLAIVGLPGVEGAEGLFLSASERARAALAVELFRSPKYLFLDMLLANAGREWEERLWGLFRALAKEEKTILLMERRLPDLWQGAKEIVSLSAGPFTWSRMAAFPPQRQGAPAAPAPPGEPGDRAGGESGGDGTPGQDGPAREATKGEE